MKRIAWNLLRGAVFAGLAAFPAKRPNILWLIAEDLSPDLGCYGTPEVRTPNLDRLAAEGMRFTRAFTSGPVCSASRSAFMTGMYQTSIGAHNHRSHRGDGYRLPEGVKTLVDRLRALGYFTANVVDLTGDPHEQFYRGTGKTDWNFAYEGKPFDSSRWADLKTHQPFYAQVNFAEAHRGKAWNTAHLHVDRPADPAKVKLPPYYPDRPEARADWAQYLNSVMALDKKVGFVLRKLEEDGLAENTIVVFFGCRCLSAGLGASPRRKGIAPAASAVALSTRSIWPPARWIGPGHGLLCSCRGASFWEGGLIRPVDSSSARGTDVTKPSSGFALSVRLVSVISATTIPSGPSSSSTATRKRCTR